MASRQTRDLNVLVVTSQYNSRSQASRSKEAKIFLASATKAKRRNQGRKDILRTFSGSTSSNEMDDGYVVPPMTFRSTRGRVQRPYQELIDVNQIVNSWLLFGIEKLSLLAPVSVVALLLLSFLLLLLRCLMCRCLYLDYFRRWNPRYDHCSRWQTRCLGWTSTAACA